MADSLRNAQLRQEYRAEIMRGYQAALCNSDVPGWTLGDEVAKVADNLLAALPHLAPQPVVDREALEKDVRVFIDAAVDHARCSKRAADAVLALLNGGDDRG